MSETTIFPCFYSMKNFQKCVATRLFSYFSKLLAVETRFPTNF